MLDPTAIQVAGATLDTNGFVYLLLADTTTVDVTPSPTGSYDRYGFSVSAYKWPSPNSPVISMANGTNASTVVSGKTTTVVVGQQIVLSATLANSSKQANNFVWGLPAYPVTVGNYVPTATQSTLVTAPPLNQQGITFYFVDGGTRTVTCGFDAGGTHYTVNAAFSVIRPTALFYAQKQGPLLITNNFLRLGNGTTNSPTPPGMVFVASKFSYPGQWDFIQVVTNSVLKYNGTNGSGYTVTGFGLDQAVPYPATNMNLTFPSGTFAAVMAHDSPGIGLGDKTKVWRDDDYEMYLMFKPDLAGAIRVPIAKLYWPFSAAASNTNGWALLTPLRPNAPPSDAIYGTPWTTHPTWTNSILNNLWINMGAAFP